MSSASFSCVDVINGHLIYWFSFEGAEPNTGYYSNGYDYGIAVDDEHKITAIHYQYNNDNLIDLDSKEGVDIIHSVQNDQRPGWLDVEIIKLGAAYLYDILIDKMGGSVAESLFPGEEIVGVNLIETVVDTEIETDPLPPISSLKIH